MWPLEELRKTLAALYFTQKEIAALLIRANLKPSDYELEGKAGVVWTLALRTLEKQERVSQLVQIALEDYPDNPVLTATLNGQSTVKSVYAGIKPDWRGSPGKGELEKILGQQNTLLPISFLEIGMRKAASVARIVTPNGSGTGFLISANGFLLTNNHVLENATVAGKSVVQFNYQLTPKGLPDTKEEFEIDNSFFKTSINDDWSIVKLKGNPAETYGYLELKKVMVKKDDFVNIIQHPGGEYKQIAMYHNLVTYANENIIQYLTDTMPGSSGSPVFNSLWEVVALHHSGGWLEEPGLSREVLRNEGVNINCVISAIEKFKSEGVL